VGTATHAGLEVIEEMGDDRRAQSDEPDQGTVRECRICAAESGDEAARTARNSEVLARERAGVRAARRRSASSSRNSLTRW
jgi:hypothetical protein